MPEPVTVTALLVIATITSVIYYAGHRGKKSVTGFYRRRVTAWKGSSPAPAPWGIKAGAVIATGAVGGFLYAWGFVKGLREGMPDGAKTAREWYAKRLAAEKKKEEELPGLCPVCKFNLAKNNWPVQHQNHQGELCRYDWHTDPRWERCPDCKAILVPGTKVCTDCERIATNKQSGDADAPKVAQDKRCRATHDGKQCPETADPLLGNGYCTKDDALAAAAGQRPAGKTDNGRPRMRLVADPDGATEGANSMAIQTATNGDVRNLEQTLAELDAIIKEQVAEYEDAGQALNRAEADLAACEELKRWLIAEQFPPAMQGTAGDLANDLAGVVQAAKDRVAAADQQIQTARDAQTKLAPHGGVKAAVHDAGGMANRSGYAV
ncbi:hypothetical protein AB0B10_25910 [Micromonospora arborensis]|uniref:hypothetical protein n=1 Tax=Micromonospora arborensis TaxID=2116518 RepID=UPI0033F18E5A